MIVLKRKTLQTTESAENKILKLSTSGNDLYYRKLHELQFVFYRKLQIITCKMFSVIGLERMLNFLYLLSILDLFVSILLSLHMLEPWFNVDYHQSYIRAFIQARLRTIWFCILLGADWLVSFVCLVVLSFESLQLFVVHGLLSLELASLPTVFFWLLFFKLLIV